MINLTPVRRRAMLPILSLVVASGALILSNACSSSRTDEESEDSAEVAEGEAPVASTDTAPAPEVPVDPASPPLESLTPPPVVASETPPVETPPAEAPKKKRRKRAQNAGRVASETPAAPKEEASPPPAAIGSTQDNNQAPPPPPPAEMAPPPPAEMAPPPAPPVAAAPPPVQPPPSQPEPTDDSVASTGGSGKWMETLMAYRLAIAAALATAIAGGGAFVFSRRGRV